HTHSPIKRETFSHFGSLRGIVRAARTGTHVEAWMKWWRRWIHKVRITTTAHCFLRLRLPVGKTEIRNQQ
ncbi:MAG: hypothetical protein WCA11_17645, partial [Terracidiphilus sp.]